jgi:hypothetical protein
MAMKNLTIDMSIMLTHALNIAGGDEQANAAHSAGQTSALYAHNANRREGNRSRRTGCYRCGSADHLIGNCPSESGRFRGGPADHMLGNGPYPSVSQPLSTVPFNPSFTFPLASREKQSSGGAKRGAERDSKTSGGGKKRSNELPPSPELKRLGAALYQSMQGNSSSQPKKSKVQALFSSSQDPGGNHADQATDDSDEEDDDETF